MYFFITDGKPPSSLFIILIELSFVNDPLILYFIEIHKIKGASKPLRKFIIQFSFSVEGIVAPEAFISRLIFFIIEYSTPPHFIFVDLTFIESSIMKN
jgi:hypothetical protein